MAALDIIKEMKKEAKRKEGLNAEYYSALRSLLGNDWAMFYMMLGGREAGKSYAVTQFFVHQWRKYKRPFYWIRLTEEARNKLLKNNAEKLIDPDIRRKYNIELETRGDIVYEIHRGKQKEDGSPGKVTKREMICRVLSLSTFYNDKGSGLFDKDFLNDPKMYYNIAFDEMNREQSERNTFDIVYSFVNQLENLVRSTKRRLRIICIGNTLQEASDLLAAFDFIPETFGRFKLRSKRCIMEYIEPSEKYLSRRKGTVADILLPDASTFTNRIETDKTLILKKRLVHPSAIILFSKDKKDKFTIWQGNIVSQYNNENAPKMPMKPYLDELYIPAQRNEIIEQFDARAFKFDSMITFKKFQAELQMLRKK